jgi:hypothetical protein
MKWVPFPYLYTLLAMFSDTKKKGYIYAFVFPNFESKLGYLISKSASTCSNRQPYFFKSNYFLLSKIDHVSDFGELHGFPI